MTVNSKQPSKTYTATAGATVFPYDFRIFVASDLHVEVNGVLKVLSSDYTVSGADNPAGGNVTFGTPMTGGETIVIAGDIPAERDTDYQEGGDLLGKTHNNDHDYPVMLAKQIIARSMLAPVGDAQAGNMSLPSIQDRKGKFLGFDATGKPVVVPGTNLGVDISEYTALPTGGTVAIALKTLLRPVTILSFGGKMNDSTFNNAAAIRRMAAALGRVFIPEGMCYVDGSDTGTLAAITNSDWSFRGAGRSKTLLYPISGAPGCVWIKGDGNVHEAIEIDGFAMHGDGTRGAGDDYFVWLNTINDGTVRNCTFQGGANGGGNGKACMASAGAVDIHFEDLVFNANSGEDINFYGGDGPIYRMFASRTQHYQPQGPAIEIEGRSGTTITGHEVYDVLLDTILIRSDNGSYVNCGDSGVLAIGARGLSAMNVNINRRGTNGYKIIGCQNVGIHGGNIQDMGATGADYTYGAGIVFTAGAFGTAGGSINVNVSGVNIDNCRRGIAAYVGESNTGAQTFTIGSNILTNHSVIALDVETVAGLVVEEQSYRGNAGNSNYVNNTGAVHIKDPQGSGTIYSMPFVCQSTHINHGASGAVTLDISTGNNRFDVDLDANVTGIAVSGTPKAGMELTINFLQSTGGTTVTTTAANWTTNSVADFKFAVLTVPTLGGGATTGRVNTITFVREVDNVGNSYWIHKSHNLNCG